MTQLKTKIIETPKARVLVVGGFSIAPTDFIMERINCVSFLLGDIRYATNVPEGNWQLLGKLESITEDQWKGIVGSVSILKDKSDERYMNYRFYDEIAYGDCFRTATESGLSLIESEVSLKNPQKKPKGEDYLHGSEDSNGMKYTDPTSYVQYHNLLRIWQLAEEQVFHNPVLWYELKSKK